MASHTILSHLNQLFPILLEKNKIRVVIILPPEARSQAGIINQMSSESPAIALTQHTKPLLAYQHERISSLNVLNYPLEISEAVTDIPYAGVQ